MRERGARRVLSLLLRLYPPGFRLSLGEDLVETALFRLRDARSRSRFGAWSFWSTEGVRFALDGVLERLRSVPFLLTDLQHGWRQVLRAPAHYAVAVATLGLGIAATTTIFTVTDAVVFRPLPYDDADELYLVHSRFNELELSSNSLLNLRDLQSSVRTFSWLAGATDNSPSLTDEHGEAERVSALAVTENYLPGLGARLRRGRAFVPADHAAGADRVAIVSHGLWQRRWGGSDAVLGARIRLNASEYTIVGVMSPSYRDPEPIESGAVTGVWLPARPDRYPDRDHYAFRVIGRLPRHTPLHAAQAELSAVGARLAAEYPDANRPDGTALDFALYSVRDLTVGDARARLLLLFGAVVLLLVLSCANVANLFLARGVTRVPELTVRNALGATRGRLALQLFGESLLTAAIAGVVGGMLGAIALRGFLALAPAGMPRLHEVTLDTQALGFIVLLTMLTAALFGSLPAWRGAQQAATTAHPRLTAARGTQRLQSALVAFEVAIALVLVTGSGLLLNSLRHLLHVDVGFDARDVTVLEVRPPVAANSHARELTFYRELQQRVQAIPGVAHTALVYTTPGSSGGMWSRVTLPEARTAAPTDRGRAPVRGEEPGEDFIRINAVHGDFADALDIPLRAGQLFADQPGMQDPLVVVLNEAAARRFFPDDDMPLGRRLALGAPNGPAPMREVIGVVGDIHQRGPAHVAEPQIYVPYGQRDVNRMSLVVETRAGVVLPPDAIRYVVRDVAPDVPIDRLEPLATRYAATGALTRFLTFLVSAFAAIGLVLAVVGTYATAAHALSRRLRELGIRRALGADSAALFRLVLRRALAIAGVGIALGLLLSTLLTRFLRSYVFGVAPHDPLTFAAAALLLGGFALLASCGPALRATRVEPNDVLRGD